MGTAYLSNTAIGLAVAEVTAGTYVDPTTADIKMYDVEPITVDQTPIRIGNLASGTFQKGKWVSGVKTASTSFKTYLQSSGTPTVAPVMGKLFSVSNLHEYTDTNIGYRWDGIPTCGTVSFKNNVYQCGPTPVGFSSAMRGAVAALTISADAVGAPIMCNFALSGAAVPDADISAAAPTVPSGFDTADCEKLLGVSFTLGAVAQKVQSFTIDFASVVSMQMDGSTSAEGIETGYIADGDPTLTVEIINSGVAAQDFYGDQASDTVYSTATMSLQNWDFTFTNLQIQESPRSDKDGLEVRTITLSFEKFEMIQK